MAKHHSKPHSDVHGLSVAAHRVLVDYKNQLDGQTEEIRQDYERQLVEKGNDDWLRNIATSLIVFYEITGSRQKTEKFAVKLDEKLRTFRANETPTREIVDTLERLTDICVSVEE